MTKTHSIIAFKKLTAYQERDTRVHFDNTVWLLLWSTLEQGGESYKNPIKYVLTVHTIIINIPQFSWSGKTSDGYSNITLDANLFNNSRILYVSFHFILLRSKCTLNITNLFSVIFFKCWWCQGIHSVWSWISVITPGNVLFRQQNKIWLIPLL